MRIAGILTLLVLVLSLPLLAADGTKFTVDVSGFLLTQVPGTSVPLVSLYANAGTGDVFTTGSAALNTWKPGGDLRLGYAWSKLGVEVRGFLLSRWSNATIYTSNGENLAIETNPITSYGMGSAGNTLTATNDGRLKGFEANLTYDLAPKVRLYGGFRYLQLNGTFDLYGYFGESSYENDLWATTNKLLGGQIGARVDILRPAGEATRGFVLQGHGAFALFSNSAHTGFTTNYSGEAIYDIAADSHKLTPAVDAGVQAGYRMGRLIELHVGYNLLWMSSVSQAIRQVAGTTSYNETPTIALVYKDLVVHGAQAGITVRF